MPLTPIPLLHFLLLTRPPYTYLPLLITNRKQNIGIYELAAGNSQLSIGRILVD